MIVSLMFCAVALMAICYLVYVNCAWYRDCNELNEKLAEQCDELNKKYNDICKDCKRCKNLREEKK